MSNDNRGLSLWDEKTRKRVASEGGKADNIISLSNNLAIEPWNRVHSTP